MRKIWLLLLVLAVPSQINAQTPPPPFLAPPNPPVLSLPDCPYQLMGVLNDTFYYATKVCPNGVTGFGQTSPAVSVLDCIPSTTQCNNPIRLFLQGAKSNKYKSVELNACSLGEGSPEELEQKLAKIIAECKKLQKYLEKVAKSPDITPIHKTRVETWVGYLKDKLIPYLEYTGAGADPVETKISNYCTSDPAATPPRKSVIEVFREHETTWNTSFIDWAKGRGYVEDTQQLGALPTAGSIPITADPLNAYKITDRGVYKVTVKDLPGFPSKTVYFNMFTIELKNDFQTYTHVGVQISAPANSAGIKDAEFKDRHQYGHLIKSKIGSAVFLVSSVDDLSIAPDP